MSNAVDNVFATLRDGFNMRNVPNIGLIPK